MPERDATEPYLPPIAHPLRAIGVHAFDLDRQVAVVATIDHAPDASTDEGRVLGVDVAVRGALEATAAGADWLDVGGDDVERMVLLVRELRAASDVVISVRASHARLAAAAIEAGADAIEDATSAGDGELAAAVAGSDATLVVTQSLDVPAGPEADAAVEDDVVRLLQERVELAVAGGVREDRIVVDPGVDLGGHTVESLRLVRHLPAVADLGFPVLATLSRTQPIDDPLAIATFAVTRGARLLRVRDVARTREAVQAVEALMGWRAPADPIQDLSAFDV